MISRKSDVGINHLTSNLTEPNILVGKNTCICFARIFLFCSFEQCDGEFLEGVGLLAEGGQERYSFVGEFFC